MMQTQTGNEREERKGQLIARLVTLKQELAELRREIGSLDRDGTGADGHGDVDGGIVDFELDILDEPALARMYMDIADTILLVLNRQGEIAMINPRGCRLLGYEKSELIGKNWFLFCLPESIGGQVYDVFERLISGNKGLMQYYENPIVTRGGEERLIAWHNTALRNEAGEIVATFSSGEDITARKEALESLRASLEEKEILLKEIHHRVKNNMAIISSMLHLQAALFKDEQVIEAFKEAQHRIRSMVLVHETLYRADNLAKIDFSYYLRELTRRIAHFTTYRGPTPHIATGVRAEGIWLTIDTAIPCGMIVNELITNAYKYAFAGREGGRIDVEMVLESGSRYRLTVSDNGVGLPAHIRLGEETTSFGLHLVGLLVRQLRGEIRVDREGGTTIEIGFPLEDL